MNAFQDIKTILHLLVICFFGSAGKTESPSPKLCHMTVRYLLLYFLRKTEEMSPHAPISCTGVLTIRFSAVTWKKANKRQTELKFLDRREANRHLVSEEMWTWRTKRCFLFRSRTFGITLSLFAGCWRKNSVQAAQHLQGNQKWILPYSYIALCWEPHHHVQGSRFCLHIFI